MRRFILFSILITFTASTAAAENQFVIHGTVTSFHKQLNKATAANSERVQKIFKLIHKRGVPRKYIVTSELGVRVMSAGYRHEGNYRVIGYEVSRNIRVVLHDPKKIEPSFGDLFSVGIEQLRLTLHHTDASSYEDKAFAEAAATAKRRASRLASTLGRKLGKAMRIAEENAQSSQTRSFTYSANTPDLGASLSLDKIRIASTVRVSFELL